MQLEYFDDGLGIDVDKFRKKALIDAHDENLNFETLLKLMFKPGFSTVDTVSQFSGRGVGMDAIQSAIVEHDGTITVLPQKADASIKQSRHLPVKFIISLPDSLYYRLGSNLTK